MFAVIHVIRGAKTDSALPAKPGAARRQPTLRVFALYKYHREASV